MINIELDETKKITQVLEIRQFGISVGGNINEALNRLNEIAITTKKKDIKIDSIIEDIHGNIDIIYSWLIDVIK